MTVSPIDLKNQTATSAVKREPKSALGKDDFLMLMVGKLQNQDPMNPTDDSQFMAQMAQMTSLEQMTNMSVAMSQTQAFGMLGKTVSYTDGNGAVATGTVDRVVMNGSKVTLKVGEAEVAPDKVTSVLNGTGEQPTTGSAPSPAPATGSGSGTGTGGTGATPATGDSTENPTP